MTTTTAPARCSRRRAVAHGHAAVRDDAAAAAGKRLTASVDDFTLHADTAVAASDRDGLERLARYGARLPFAHQRLRLTPTGQVACRPAVVHRPDRALLSPVCLAPSPGSADPPAAPEPDEGSQAFAAHAALRGAVATVLATAARARRRMRTSTGASPPPARRPSACPGPSSLPPRVPRRPSGLPPLHRPRAGPGRDHRPSRRRPAPTSTAYDPA